MRALALIVTLCAGLQAQGTASEETIWKQFVAWFETAEAPSEAALRAKLAHDGLSSGEVEARMKLIGTRAERHKDEMTALSFNKMYTAPKAHFNTEPNAYLARMTKDLPAGTALDVAMGQGRNAIYLAKQGWRVTGFDIAKEGLAAAQAAASRAGVKITTVLSDWKAFDFGTEKWDLVVFSYAWVPLADAGFVSRVRTALKPGGVVVIEHPGYDPAKPPLPVDGANALTNAWAPGFRILHYEDTEDMCDWRLKKDRILRMVAKKW